MSDINLSFREFVDNLKTEEHRPTALNEIKNFLMFKSQGEVIQNVREVGLSQILKCLNVTDKTQFDLTCEVMRICFNKFNVGDIVHNYPSHIMYLLRHDNDCVRSLAIDEVYKTVNTDPQLMPVPEYIDIFVAVAQLVTDPDIGVANKAVLITSQLPFEAYPKVLEEMLIALDYNNNAKCNAYEVVINVSSKNLDYLNLCNQFGYIDHMLAELKSDDILFQLNLLELLSRLAVTPHGINHLVEHGALQTISESVSELKNNPLENILLPGYMKFFGTIAHIHPREIFENFPVLLDSLFDILESREQIVLPVALDTLGFIGSTIEGKLCLAALGSKYTEALNDVCELIRNSATEIKIRALLCMASLISAEKDPNWPKNKPIDHRVTLMTREWFRCLSEKPESMESLYGMCRNPFPDIRLAAFSLLDAACEHLWGQELVARTPGFIEYLLDRTVDYTKESKEAKYEVIKRLSQSTSFDANVILRLTKYLEEGPFYTETTLEVAMEEGD